MSTFDLFTSPSAPSAGSRVFARASSLARRIVKTWQERRSERALESLSYDTLKDIGYPASTDSRNTPAR